MKRCGRWKDYIPHILMTLTFLAFAIFIVFVQSLISGGGVSSVVFVFYEHLVSTFLLSTLAFFFERGKRPPITLKVFCWASLVGLLKIPLAQLLLTSSLGYISATFQSSAIHSSWLLSSDEKHSHFAPSMVKPSKLWGIILSLTGAIIMVLCIYTWGAILVIVGLYVLLWGQNQG